MSRSVLGLLGFLGRLGPMDFLGLYGRRKAITELRMRVDDPGKLRAALGRT